MRGRSYTPSPPRGYGGGRRGRSPAPRGRNGRGDDPTSLLVRNLRHDCRPEDLRRPFSQFGQVKDIYLPRDYYTGDPRGFGFVQYVEPSDAAEAKYQMDGQLFQGRELTVVFAEENRKKPTEMRHRERGGSERGGGERGGGERGGGGGRGRVYDRRRSPPRYSHSPEYSRSPPPRQGGGGGSQSRSRGGGGYYSPKRKHSRSVSPPPHEKRYSRDRSYSRSPPPPPFNGSRNPPVEVSPPRRVSPYGSRSRSTSPIQVRARSLSRSRSRSPYPAQEYTRRETRRERSPSQ